MIDVPVHRIPEITPDITQHRLRPEEPGPTHARWRGTLALWITLWVALAAGVFFSTRGAWRVLSILAEPPLAVVVATADPVVTSAPHPQRSARLELDRAELTLTRAELQSARERVRELEVTLGRERREHAHKRQIIGELQAQIAASRVSLDGRSGTPPGSRRSRRSTSNTRRARTRNPLSTSTPTVRLIGSDALILATVRNSSDSEVEARLIVELLIDGSPYGKERLVIPVPAGATVPFSTKISTSLTEGTYSGRITVE